MAEREFSRSMSNKDLCEYLEEIGLEGDDLRKIQSKCFRCEQLTLDMLTAGIFIVLLTS